MSLLIALALLAAPQEFPSIKIETVPGKGYVAVVGDFPPDRINAVAAWMAKLAERRCGTLKLRFGRFKYDNGVTGQGVAQVQNYRQSFSCYDPATDPYKAAPADWKPSAQDEKDLTAFANRYLTALDRGDLATGPGMMEPMIEITDKEWMDVPSKLAELAGGRGTWTAQTLGWANNPEGAAHPGSYALVGVDGRYPKLAAYCGTLLIYRQGPGRYQVSQQNIRVIPQSWVDEGEILPGEIEKMCAG